MGIKKIVIKDNETGKNPTKRLVAEVTDDSGKTKVVYFGLKNSGGTFFDGATEEKKKRYIDSHGDMGEKWGSDGAKSAGFYSRWALWESRSKTEIKRVIKEKSGASTVTVSGMSKIKVKKPK